MMMTARVRTPGATRGLARERFRAMKSSIASAARCFPGARPPRRTREPYVSRRVYHGSHGDAEGDVRGPDGGGAEAVARGGDARRSRGRRHEHGGGVDRGGERGGAGAARRRAVRAED